MKFVYFGSSEFSKIVLDGLCRHGQKPQLVVSKPDKPKGRGLRLAATEVSLFAKTQNIPLSKPKLLNDKSFAKQLKAEACDYFIIVDYGNIIPSDILSLAKKFACGLHPSLLPKYRGPAPIEYALLNGDQKTGLTIFKVSKRVDAGDIIFQKEVVISSKDDHYSLSRKLAEEGARFLAQGLSKIESNNYRLIKQNEAQASLTTKFSKGDGQINWQLPAEDIWNLIRAIIGWPSAYTYYQGRLLKVIEAEVVPGETGAKPGEVIKIEAAGIWVATGKEILHIRRIQPEGKKVIAAWDFVSGYRLKVGGSFGPKT